MTMTENCGGVYISGSVSIQCTVPGYAINDSQGPVEPELINPEKFDFLPILDSYAKNVLVLI